MFSQREEGKFRNVNSEIITIAIAANTDLGTICSGTKVVNPDIGSVFIPKYKYGDQLFLKRFPFCKDSLAIWENIGHHSLSAV